MRTFSNGIQNRGVPLYTLDMYSLCAFILQVLVIALLTALVQYPNPYTRFNASQVIRKLFSQCGPEDTGDLWSVARLYPLSFGNI